LANPTALLSWAHDTATWQTTLVEFAVLLRRYGVDADIVIKLEGMDTTLTDADPPTATIHGGSLRDRRSERRTRIATADRRQSRRDRQLQLTVGPTRTSSRRRGQGC
jgi:hypothetical protein